MRQSMRYARVPVAESRTDLSESPTYAEAQSVASRLLDAFVSRDVDRVDIVFADFRSAGSQPPTAATLLPVGAVAAEKDKKDAHAHADEYLFDPDAGAIFKALGADYTTNTVYRMLLSAVASEMLARRIARKSASDHADDLERALTRDYNRARQANITQEIAEIVGGAAALQG